MMRWWRALREAIVGVCWPRACVCLTCSELSRGELLCEDCAATLRMLRRQLEVGEVRSAYQYNSVARRLVISLKHNSMADAASVLAEAMAEEARDMQLPPDTVLTWVSMPEKRRRVRGIDHGKVLCTAVGERLGLPVRRLLLRRKKVHTQQGLSALERQENLKDVFICPEPVHGPVLLIDDVMTTGATSQVCSAALMEAGAEAVYVLTATRVAHYQDSNF